MSLNDLQSIRRLLERQSHLFRDVPPAFGRRKVFIYNMDAWQLGVFEMFLHLGLLRKGHAPRSVYDDGLLPLCAWENITVKPPSRLMLKQRFEFMYDSFGIRAAGVSSYLDPQSVRGKAEVLVGRTPDHELTRLAQHGIAVGAIALRDLYQYTLGRFEPATPEDFCLYRRHLVHAVMSVDLARAILARERPDVVVLVNGKSVMYSYMYEFARREGIRVVTWEEGGFFDASVILAHDDRAIDFPIDDAAWRAARSRPLSPEADRAVTGYFDRWRRQEARYYTFYDRPESDWPAIQRRLDLPAGAKIISLFANVIWDTNALDRDLAFGGMFDWICRTVEYARGRPEVCLIVRAHPGEVRLSFKTRTPICETIRSYFGERLPPNVRLIGADSPLCSYTIARHSHRYAVYTSTLGAELTLMGLRPLICGRPLYAGRGLTCDVETPEQYFDWLDSANDLPEPDVEGLKKLLHLVVFRLVKKPEFFDGIHGHPQKPRIRIESFEGFPESMPVFDEIVECVATGRPFVTVEPRDVPCIA